ncbi:TIGR01244 family sulfur transferase [Maritimibacter sp. UBA3975]|uniref:TIGR01244 family sulfur transferase n=1 Tax=Maritimibacter sp. UBA3975 TaxID=1946833 RepID=UPI000C094AF6|nr:TIGR01244 family sulfur transferase [Maritimibacter sp. UBA3975]MAM60315.1 TIGR01244 family phosphatase [Maritimibacter sp.]|tara:strand:- start:29300 stop:29632 length:333 start_codon:yes stop_codon:yes gene_type:complete
MDMSKLDDHVTVAPQIAVADVAEIKALGYTGLMCNRPDGEDPSQPAWAEIEAAAQEAGLKTYFLPVQSRPEAEIAAEGFAKAMEENDKLFAYCRSGTRCQLIYQAAKARA